MYFVFKFLCDNILSNFIAVPTATDFYDYLLFNFSEIRDSTDWYIVEQTIFQMRLVDCVTQYTKVYM